MPLPIFGPQWAKQNTQFIPSDDRVRGGSSQSHLETESDSNGEYARFWGVLDTETLGGAGFASQKTKDVERVWDLSNTEGLLLDILKADGKRYTLTVSNQIAEKRPDGRDTSTLLYEYSFDAPTSGPLQIHAPWKEFKAMYRGKPKDGAPGLDLGNIRRWSFMIRSFFDQQHGEFCLKLRCVSGYKKGEDRLGEYNGLLERREFNEEDVAKGEQEAKVRCCSIQ